MNDQESRTDSAVNPFDPPPRARHKMGWRPLVYGGFLVTAMIGGVLLGMWIKPLWPSPEKNRDLTPDPNVTTQPLSNKQLWTCGMHPQVIQDQPGECPICHMELMPLATEAGPASSAKQQRRIKYWWDPMMNPPYISDKPGKSPMGMDLVPVYEEDHRGGGGASVRIDPAVVQNMGLRLAKVEHFPIRQEVRAVGYLQEPEPLQRDINLRVSGWVQTLHANTNGMLIEAGKPLFDLYSPELQVGIEELITARRAWESAAAVASGSSEGRSDSIARALYESAVSKLRLWGLEEQQVMYLAQLEKAPATVSFLSPIWGHLTEKHVNVGSYVRAGDLVLRLSDRSRLWLEVQVYETQLPVVPIGSRALAQVPSQPGDVFEGQVVFIHPHLDPATRTALVRVEVPNKDGALRQGMYATVELQTTTAPPTLTVPREAIIDSGRRQIVFVAGGDGRFEPRPIRTGFQGQGRVQVLEGLEEGQEIVTSGQFLLDAESRLQEAIQKHLAGDSTTPSAVAGHATHTAPLNADPSGHHADDSAGPYEGVSKP